MTRQWPLSLKLGKYDIVNYFVGFGHGQDPEPGQGHGGRGHGRMNGSLHCGPSGIYQQSIYSILSTTKQLSTRCTLK